MSYQYGQAPTGQQGTAPPPAQSVPQQTGGGRNVTLDDGISEDMRVALHDFVESANVTEWCAEQCIDEGPQMAECVRLCRDVADIARMNAQLLARDSEFGPEMAELFIVAAEACAEECAKHSHRHCQECAEVLPRAARATRKMLASFETGPTNTPQTQGTQVTPGTGGQF